MSSIGPSGFIPSTFAGHAAASNALQKDHQQTVDLSKNRSFQQDLQIRTNEKNAGVSDPDFSADRDADGRLLAEQEQQSDQHPATPEQTTASPQDHSHSIDPDGNLGTHLDLQA